MKKRMLISGLLTLGLLLTIFLTGVFAAAAEWESDIRFLDVDESDYYHDAVVWAVEQEITVGTTETAFSPEAPCTRAQMVEFLWRAAGSPSAWNTYTPFMDVSADAYCYDAVLWAVEQGITAGTTSATFSPDAALTRGQTVTFLYRAAGSPRFWGDHSFADVTGDAYYADAVMWAAEEGITSGTSATTFSPDAACTRGQVVTFLFRSQKNDGDTLSGFEARSIPDDGLGMFRYWLYTPSDPTEQMPLIVYLHGGSGKGDDLNLITSAESFPQYLQTGELGDVRAYVLIPQLPSDQKGWASASGSLYQLIQSTISEFHLDSDNISLTGHSMGGTGTWNLATEYPELFARIAPLSGSAKGTADTAETLSGIPVWALVGSADTIVPPESSEEMVSALEEVNADAELTVFDGADHFAVPSLAYLDKDLDLVGWLIGETGESNG